MTTRRHRTSEAGTCWIQGLLVPACVITGYALGVLIAHAPNPPSDSGGPPDRQEGPSPDSLAGSEDRVTQLLDGMELRVSALEARGTGIPGEPGATAPPPSPADLFREFSEAVEGSDPSAVERLLRQLASMGEAGFTELVDALRRLHDMERPPDDALRQVNLQQLSEDAAFHPFLIWCLIRPNTMPPWLRRLAVEGLKDSRDIDVGRLFLDAIHVNSDPDLRGLLAESVYGGRLRPALLPVIEAAAAISADAPRAIDFLMDAIAELDSPESDAALRRLALHRDPRISEVARSALTSRAPPVPGVLLASVNPESPWGKAGLRAGDIIRSIDGIEFRLWRESSPGRWETTIAAPPDWVKGIRLNANVRLQVFRPEGEVEIPAPATWDGWTGQDVPVPGRREKERK